MNGFDESFDRLYAVGYRTAYRLLGDRDEAADVAQESAARAFASWRRVAEYSDAWVARVSANLALDHLRRSRRSRSSAAGVLGGGGESAALDRIDLYKALRKLSRGQRDVIVLRYLADQPEAVVASLLGITVGTVKSQASRGLTSLRTSVDLAGEPR